MGDEGQNIPIVLETLLNLVHEELDANQRWELDVHLGYDELEVTFELLCSMLRDRGSQLSPPARELLTRLALELNTDEQLWGELALPRGGKSSDREPQS